MNKSPFLIAAALGCVLAVPLIGYDLLQHRAPAGALGLNTIEPAAGESADAMQPPVHDAAVPAEPGPSAMPAAPLAPRPAPSAMPPRLIPADTTTADIVPTMGDKAVRDSTAIDQGDEAPPLRLTSDQAEVVQLDRDAINILVGSDKNLRVVPDTNRTLILIPKQPGSTYFKALDADGRIIMQRHIIVGAPKNEYIRIRRACVNGVDGCKEYSVYYCPDMCHEVSVSQDEKRSSPAVPEEAPNARAGQTGSTEAQGNQQDDTPVPDTLN